MSQERPRSRLRRLRRPALALAVALGAPGVVTLLAFTTVRTAVPALLYTVAIICATAAGGRVGGAIAVAASGYPFFHFFASRYDRPQLNGEGATALAIFVLAALFGSEALGRQRAARERAERAVAASRTALDAATRLQRVADALAGALTPQEVLDAVLTESVEAARARAGLIATLSDDGEWLDVIAMRGYDEQILDDFARFPVAGDYPLSEAVRTGQGVFLGSADERDERYPELRGRSRPDGHGVACLPLTVASGTIGGIVFSFADDQDFPPARRALKVALARQAAVALERARLLVNEQQLGQRIAFLGEATAILGSSLDLERTLQRLSELAVPTLADWCAVDLLADDGQIETPVITNPDPQRARWADDLRRRTHGTIESEGAIPSVIRTGEPVFAPDLARELLEKAAEASPRTAEILGKLDLRGWACIPLKAGGRTFGALTLVTEGTRVLTEADFSVAEQLAERAAVAVENARLYREAERRADAAMALAYVGDGVVLVDHAGRVRHWNAAMAAMTGGSEEAILGHEAREVVPHWEQLTTHVELASADAPERARPVTLPVLLGERERWFAVTGVAFEGGVVYAVRDVSEEQALERARNDFVATASHELRTPLAAVYGAARTLRRQDLELLPEQQETFIEIIESETERLTGIVAQILLAGQLDSGRVDVAPVRCDLQELGESVLASARLRAPENVELRLVANGAAPVALADPDKLRQVVVNLVDNGIKYSPDGGAVEIELGGGAGRAELAVRDHGLGIPPHEREKVFEKFYRLDPALTRGVGGTGLGLYISRELVTRMGGTIRIEATPGGGTTFRVTLPAT